MHSFWANFTVKRSVHRFLSKTFFELLFLLLFNFLFINYISSFLLNLGYIRLHSIYIVLVSHFLDFLGNFRSSKFLESSDFEIGNIDTQYLSCLFSSRRIRSYYKFSIISIIKFARTHIRNYKSASGFTCVSIRISVNGH